ncbi:GIY-YIG nuclease family protein [Streptomyces hundungensis]|uniref:GIY-YIG nuclease family protein n=1 Tax=Streptomyces hundungensis TaxID=1077946 RepID=UPI0033F31871
MGVRGGGGVTPIPVRLSPTLVRALIPPQRIGTYVLYADDGRPTYVGRSDTDIRRRLLRHCSDRRGDYFTYDVHHSATSAYMVECALFHLLTPDASNRIHPARPEGHRVPCTFCLPQQHAARRDRIHAAHEQARPATTKDRR